MFPWMVLRWTTTRPVVISSITNSDITRFPWISYINIVTPNPRQLYFSHNIGNNNICVTAAVHTTYTFPKLRLSPPLFLKSLVFYILLTGAISISVKRELLSIRNDNVTLYSSMYARIKTQNDNWIFLLALLRGKLSFCPTLKSSP